MDKNRIASPVFTSSRLPAAVQILAEFVEPATNGFGSHYSIQLHPTYGHKSYRRFNAIDIVVCGAHMSGMALNDQLTQRQAVLVQKTLTASNYRFYALAGGPPYRPGLVRDNINGAAIEVEIWRMPSSHFGSFMKLIPHPLGVGTVELENGQWCNSFICEPCGLEGATDITDLGSWRVFIADLD